MNEYVNIHTKERRRAYTKPAGPGWVAAYMYKEASYNDSDQEDSGAAAAIGFAAGLAVSSIFDSSSDVASSSDSFSGGGGDFGGGGSSGDY